jgi:RNA polymerase sigma factor (sigma-70 family)
MPENDVPERSDASADRSSKVSSLPHRARWPDRLKEVSRKLRHSPGGISLDKARGEAWKILFLALSIYIRYHSTRLGGVSREDMEDLAAEKSLDLLRRIVSGEVDLSSPTPGEIVSFISKVARNDLVDLVKRRGRRVEPRDEDRPEWDIGGETGEGVTMSATVGPDTAIERREFAEALRSCAEKLDPRSRLVWFFRVFYSMATKDIAAHPAVRLRVGHVDVLLQRVRRTIRDCMDRQGFQPEDMPPGSFTELWHAFRLNEARSPMG